MSESQNPEDSSTPPVGSDLGPPSSDFGPPGSAFGPPAKDPWKGFRGVCAGTLILEAIVVLLALPVAATVGGGVSWLSGGYIGLLALAMVLGAGLQGKSWAMTYNLVLQAAMIAGFLVHPALGVLGLIFAGVWGYLIYLRRDITRRLDQGLLPGQRD